MDFSVRKTSRSPRQSRLAHLLNGAVAIDADVTESEERRGRLLNMLALTGLLVAAVLLLMIVAARSAGILVSADQALRFSLFPLGFVPISLFCMSLAKHGRIQLASRLYVWVSFGMIALGAGLFNGFRSASWLLMIWPVALAGSLLQPISSGIAALAASLVYLGVAVVEGAGIYEPVMPTSLESFPFFSIWFGWIMLVVAVGLVDYINGRSLQGALSDLRTTSSELAAARNDLSQRVEARTAALAQRAEQFRAVAELAQAASSARDLESVLNSAVTLISSRLGYYHAGIFLLDGSRQWAELRAASSEGGKRMVTRQHRLRVGQQGIVGYVAEMGISRYAFNVGDDAAWFNNPDLPETRSEMALPLIISDRVIGVLDIQTREQSAFDEADLETLGVLANGVAVAVENVRRLQEMQTALARLERYQEADAIRAWRQALSRRRMQVGYTYTDGATSASPVKSEALVPLMGVVERVTQERAEDGRYLLYAPINVSGRRLGVLAFESASSWSDEALRLVETIVNQLDLALTNARLLEETRLRATQEAARGEIVGRIRALNSTDAILRNAAEELGRALQVERSRIQLVQVASGDESRA